jgi:hypothetical protein
MRANGRIDAGLPVWHKRRTELEQNSYQFLNAFRCEAIPERAAVAARIRYIATTTDAA